MRRALATALVSGVALVATAGVARGVSPQPIVGGPGNVFSDSSYTLGSGSVATLQWTGGGPHNVTADAKGPDGEALFRSATISGGSTPVNGSQFLAAGSYPFNCTIHPGMVSSLTVAGVPQARPTLSLKILSRKLGPVAKSGKLKLSSTLTGAPSAEFVAKLGAKTLGSASGGNGVTKLKLTRSGKRLLAAKKKAKVKVQGTVDFGSPVTAVAKLK